MGTSESAAFYREPFHQGLRELGYSDATEVTVVARYANGDPTRIPVLVDELTKANVDVMLLIPQAVPIAIRRRHTKPGLHRGPSLPAYPGEGNTAFR
jgi:hypothetical protein